jgi:hypothetical protein
VSSWLPFIFLGLELKFLFPFYSPGRFFVTPILKAVLSHILLNYDIRVDPEIDGAAPRPKNEHVAQYIIPNTKACVYFRRRERA